MKRIAIASDAVEIRSLLEQASDEDIILQLVDGRKFMLSAVDDFDIEVPRTRQNKKIMALLDERAKQTGTISLVEVKQRLGIID
ncbi:MAG: hypothetical protein EBE86_023740 [Hormoscilla sp. GUM202]|nr:hypothetical protein [Hormoscilla sp. GUM202]